VCTHFHPEERRIKELCAGLPSQIYSLQYPDGENLEDHNKLVMQENIKDGYVLRVHIYEHWETLYTAITKNNIESVYHNGGVHLKGFCLFDFLCTIVDVYPDSLFG
jgi:hypothetical protein